MLTAVKGNRECRITEDQKDEFLKSGYDILDEEGNRTVAPSKTVPYAEHQKLQKEVDTLKEQNAELQKEVETLKKNGKPAKEKD